MSAAPAPTSLYITDLPPGITQAAVEDKFKAYGKITEIQLTAASQRSSQKRAATVAKISFATHEQAAEALDKCNYDEIQGSKIHITWHRTDRHQPKVDSETTIEITGFPATINEKKLHSEMQRLFGHVVSCRVTKKGQLRRGTVFFESPADAQRVLEALTQNPKLFNKNVTVAKFKPPVKQGRQREVPPQEQLPPHVLCLEWQPGTAVMESQLQAACGEGLDELIVDGTKALAVFETPEAAVKAEGEWKTPTITVSRRTLSEKLLTDVRNVAEARTVIVAASQPLALEALRAHLETVGPLATLEPRGQSGIVNARYQKRASRDAALRTLDRSTFQGQKAPITVLPFFDKHLPRPFFGLIQVNELDPTTKLEDVRSEFAQYGTIVAVSLAPPAYAEGGLYGFVLYETHDMACNAYASSKRENLFIYPALEPSEAIVAFMESPAAPNNTLVIYDLPESAVYSEIDRDLKHRFGSLSASYITRSADGSKKAAYAIFANPQKAADAYSVLKSEGKAVDIFNRNAHMVMCQKLEGNLLPSEWAGRLLYVRELQDVWGAGNLRQILLRQGIAVESCFVKWGDLGLSTRTAIVLVLYPQQAMVLTSQYGNCYRYFNGTYTLLPSIPQRGGAVRYKFPEQNSRKKLVQRDWMKQFVALNFPEVSDKLAGAIDSMSVNDVCQNMASLDYFVRWIHQAKAQM